MANTALDTILQPTVTTGVVKQVAATSSILLNKFGMQPGGPNTKQVGHRRFGYDVFNDSRKVAQGRSPGSAAAVVKRQAVGRVEGVFPRAHERVPMLLEELHNLRPIGGSSNQFDNAGESFVQKQLRIQGQKIANFRTTLLAGMLRDSLYYHTSGDDIYFDFTSTSGTQIDFKMPAANKNQLNMLGAGDIINTSWATVATAGVFDDIMAINKAFQQLWGGRLEVVICGADIWSYVTNNTDLKGRAGSANRVFEQFERPTEVVDAMGNPINMFIGRLTPLPWLEWWIMGDEGLDLGAPGSESYTSFLPTTGAIFMQRPSNEWCEMLEGSEPVVKNYGQDSTIAMGLDSWTVHERDPARVDLFTIDNALSALYVPKSVAFGTVVF